MFFDAFVVTVIPNFARSEEKLALCSGNDPANYKEWEIYKSLINKNHKTKEKIVTSMSIKNFDVKKQLWPLITTETVAIHTSKTTYQRYSEVVSQHKNVTRHPTRN